jgi:hypothetical protein
LGSLLEELQRGESRLEIDHANQLWRTVAVVGVNVFYVQPRGSILRLVEARQVFSSGDSRERALRTSLAEKQLPGEQPVAAAHRAIEEELGFSANGLWVRTTGTELTEGASASYPGLRCRRRLTFFECAIPRSRFNSDGYVERQEDKVTSFSWKKAS